MRNRLFGPRWPAIVLTALFGLGIIAAARPAEALPQFAGRYGFSCQKCHTVVPALNAFGAAFYDNGYKVSSNIPPGPAFPVSTKINLVYTSDPAPETFPKPIVDEVELLFAGSDNHRLSYFFEQYLVDGGAPGARREAWASLRLDPDAARIPLALRAGSFTLPLPLDPETFRESYQHYAVWDQVVGVNPFTFFAPKIGVSALAGNRGRGTSLIAAALQGHDEQSGLPARGIDTMFSVQHVMGPVTLSAYHYAGTRPGLVADAFARQGAGAVLVSGRFEVDSVFQTGHDSSADGAGVAARSAGGFSQIRYQFSPYVFGLARYEGTADGTGAFSRDFVGLLGTRIGHRERLTIEDVVQHVPQTKHTLNAQITIAF